MRPPGAEVGIYYDTDGEVAVGDWLRTGTGRSYFVTASRESGTARPPWSRRFRLRAVVVPPEEVPPDGIIHPVRWHSRERSRAR